MRSSRKTDEDKTALLSSSRMSRIGQILLRFVSVSLKRHATITTCPDDQLSGTSYVCAVNAPSTTRLIPLTYFASSDAR